MGRIPAFDCYDIVLSTIWEMRLLGKFIAVVIVIVLLHYSSLPAQTIGISSQDTSSASHTWTYIGIGGAVVATTVMLKYDQQIYNGLYQWKQNNHAVSEISPVITNLGDGIFSLGLFGGFMGYGLVWKNTKACEVGKIGLESYLFTGVAVQLIKQLCGRERPSAATRNGGYWHGPFSYLREPKNGRGISSFDAFPSGHTATVFAAATTISDFYPEPWVPYACYSLATLTAVSRITESTHWMSDCFVGAIIGYYGTKLIEKWNDSSHSISVQPQADEHGYGLLFSMTW